MTDDELIAEATAHVSVCGQFEKHLCPLCMRAARPSHKEHFCPCCGEEALVQQRPLGENRLDESTYTLALQLRQSPTGGVA